MTLAPKPTSFDENSHLWGRAVEGHWYWALSTSGAQCSDYSKLKAPSKRHQRFTPILLRRRNLRCNTRTAVQGNAQMHQGVSRNHL